MNQIRRALATALTGLLATTGLLTLSPPAGAADPSSAAQQAKPAVRIVGDCRTARVRPVEVILDCYDGEVALDVRRWKRYSAKRAIAASDLGQQRATARFIKPRRLDAGQVRGRVFTRIVVVLSRPRAGEDPRIVYRLVRDPGACCGWAWHRNWG